MYDIKVSHVLNINALTLKVSLRKKKLENDAHKSLKMKNRYKAHIAGRMTCGLLASTQWSH